MNRTFFTSESVAEGHPDKLCDKISDAVLDNVLTQDTKGRVACETYVTMGLVIVGGEITTHGYVDIHKLTRSVIKDIGYIHPKYGFNYNTCAIINTIHNQSPDIAQGVDKGGAGDQGTMIGYACSETPEFMPLPIMLAHKLVMRMAEVRRKGILNYLGPDGKSQVTVEYENGLPRRVDSVVLACQHTEDVLDGTKNFITKQARQEMIEEIAGPVLKEWIDKNTKYYVNETGKFTIGGPQSDTGMTGRKVVVDTYGGMVPHGGGAFSGKDPSKVDRSATYMARYIVKNIVAAGLAKKCLLQLAYVIGRAEPISIMLDTFGTSEISEEKLVEIIRRNFDLTPHAIIKTLDLLKPIYKNTASFGHFGREEFSWERLDRVKDLQKAL
jgi:S-adenosylmethionine synthetase